jgi:hypothetical protein
MERTIAQKLKIRQVEWSLRVCAGDCGSLHQQSLYNSNTRRRPTSTFCCNRAGRAPMHSVKKERSRVRSCETFTTESRGRPVTRAGNKTFPGASPSLRLLEITAAITVRIPLWLKVSAWMITTGRRKPGSEPRGSGRSAHQISPRVTLLTSGRCPAIATGRSSTLDPSWMVL